MPPSKYVVEILEDENFDPDLDYVILKEVDWNLIQKWLKICKRAGVFEEQYTAILDTTVWPMTLRKHSAFDA